MKFEKANSNCLVGIIIPLSEVAMGMLLPHHEKYAHNPYMVLDENGKLWLVWNTEIVHNAKAMEPFCLAVMRFDDEQNITDIFPFVKHGLHSSSAYNLPFDKEDIDNFSLNYVSLKANTITSGEDVTGTVKIVNYMDEFGSCIGSKSFFIDEKNHVYHELSCEFTNYIEEWTLLERRRIKDYLLFDPSEIERIYNLVQNFNPYLVFESYRIQIDYEIKHSERKPYRDYDEISKYKSYNISYLDDYLANWFSRGKELLYYKKGDRRNDDDFNIDDYGIRFKEEENEAKEKAYAEYNQYEHFECLMQKHYCHIHEHLSQIKDQKPNYPQYSWLPQAMNIRFVSYFINMWCSQTNWGRYLPAYAPVFKVLSEAVEAYNNKLVRQQIEN